jgi:DNA-binding MarR family transcriptional regulator
MSQAKLLHVVSAEPGLSLSALATRLGIGLPTCSGLVERLVEHGLVERSEDPADRRQVRVALTPTGVAQVERFRELDQRAFRRWLVLLDHDELVCLERGVRALLDRVSAARDELLSGHPTHPARTEGTSR